MHFGNIFILIALIIFGIDAIGAWKWEDFNPLPLGLWFAVFGLAWGPAYTFFKKV